MHIAAAVLALVLHSLNPIFSAKAPSPVSEVTALEFGNISGSYLRCGSLGLSEGDPERCSVRNLCIRGSSFEVIASDDPLVASAVLTYLQSPQFAGWHFATKAVPPHLLKNSNSDSALWVRGTSLSVNLKNWWLPVDYRYHKLFLPEKLRKTVLPATSLVSGRASSSIFWGLGG